MYILDGLWGFPRYGGSLSRPAKWQNTPFNDDYPSSILVSQDPVAIDSVALDFLREEFGDNMGGTGLEGGIDDYLHEAALADSPPSGTFYDPEADSTSFESLGVHEHWNNPSDKQYSRNLGLDDGIELIYMRAVLDNGTYPCDDGADNDGDGLIDLDDPDCTDAADPLEAPDADGDLVEDELDNCVQLSNPSQLDSDGDDYGNACDCDFDQNLACNIADFIIFREDYITTADRGVGTDMDGSGAVNIADFSLFRTGFVAAVPGPSGLAP